MEPHLDPADACFSKFSGYILVALSPMESSRFSMVVAADFQTAVSTVEETKERIGKPNATNTTIYKVELVLLLFHVTRHVLQTALPDIFIQNDRCYDLIERLTQPGVSNADLEDVLLQLCCGFPTDESIREHEFKIRELWLSSEHPHTGFLEMTSAIASTRMAALQQSAAQDCHCKNILQTLLQFHKSSGQKRSVHFTKKHLTRKKRVEKNPKAPLFWYQCLLGRISQIWLTRPISASRKRKQVDDTDPQVDHTRTHSPKGRYISDFLFLL